MLNRLRNIPRGAPIVALALIAGVSTASAQNKLGRSELLVTTEWLAKELKNPKLVLLHVGEKGEYDAGHIPGAQFLRLQDIASPPNRDEKTLALEMLPAEELRSRLERFGISDDSRIVIYWGNDWVSPSTRSLLTLQYAGLGAQASILDGGLPAWKKDGHAVSTEVPSPRTGKLSARPTVPVTVDGDFVKAHVRAPGYTIIDARNTIFYDGPPSEHEAKPGHIPGSVNLVFDVPFGDDNKLLPEEQLRDVFAKAGVKPNDTIIAYCHIGQQATVVVFAAQTLGYNVKLYDGSFQDWKLRGLPIESSRKADK